MAVIQFSERFQELVKMVSLR